MSLLPRIKARRTAVEGRSRSALGSAQRGGAVRRALGSLAGFSLTEALAAVVIVGLVTAILASGVALASRQYTQAMTSSEANMLFSSLQKILDTELRYTGEFKEETVASQSTVKFDSKHYMAKETDGPGGTSTFTQTGYLCTVVEDGGTAVISGPAKPGMLAMTSALDDPAALYSPLLGSGSYNYGLQASVPSITYDSGRGCFVVNLVISKGAGEDLQTYVDETFTIRAMNYYKGGLAGGVVGSSSGSNPGSEYTIVDVPVINAIELPENPSDFKEGDSLDPGAVVTYNGNVFVVVKDVNSGNYKPPTTVIGPGNSNNYLVVLDSTTVYTPESLAANGGKAATGSLLYEYDSSNPSNSKISVFSHNRWVLIDNSYLDWSNFNLGISGS